MVVGAAPGGRSRVLIVDADQDNLRWLQGELGNRYEVIAVESGASALDIMGRYSVQVLIVGSRLQDMSGSRLLTEAQERDRAGAASGEGTVSMFLADSSPSSQLPGGEDDPPVFYVLNRAVSPEHLHALVGSAVQQQSPARPAGSGGSPQSPEDALLLQRILEVSRRLGGQRDLDRAARVAINAVLEFAEADRAYCLFYDSGSGALWAEGPKGEETQGNAAVGLAGFAARTKASVCVDHVGSDPRFHAPIDDPSGNGNSRLLAQPVAGPDGEVHAVFVAIRDGKREPFEEATARLLSSLAEQVGPLLHHLALQVEADELLKESVGDGAGALFRREAIEAHMSRRQQGDVVRISPAWIRWSYWVVVILLAVGVTYLSIGTIDQYSGGMAVVRVSGRSEVIANRAGIVISTAVEPGQKVEAGDLLARFYDADEAAELERLEQEFEMQLVNVLRNPGDQNARQAVAALNARKEQAQARLNERAVFAPHGGLVTDVHARPGQYMGPGDIVLSIKEASAEMSVVAFLPGGDRPQIAPGMSLRLELIGYRYAYQDLVIDSVSSEVVGPTEVRKFLGPRLADSILVQGPVVLVKARLGADSFVADGHTYLYHDGMQGLAEVRVRTDTILQTLIPALKKL